MLIAMLFVTSCGYFSDKAPENANVFKIDELQNCKIDPSKLSEIFKANQKEQIKCLQENFIQFTKYVRAKKPGSISEDELGVFVKKFFEGQSDAIIKGISLLFQLNMILLKDEADHMSRTSISPFFQVLIQVNQEAVILSDLIKTMDDPKNQKRFWELKKQFDESTTRFATSTVQVIDQAPGLGKKLNIKNFILEMSKKIGDDEINNETVDSFIFLKKILVAGDHEVVTTDELKKIIQKLPRILSLIFDIYYVKKENFKSEAEEMRFYLMAIRNIYSLIDFSQPDFELINSNQLVKIAERIFKNYDVKSFKTSIEALKVRFIGGKKDAVTLKDLDTFLIIIHDYFEKIYFNTITYMEPGNFKILSSPQVLKSFPQKKIFGYEDFSPSRLEQLHFSFSYTALNFRYFRESQKRIASYDKAIIRNKFGFNEVNIAHWLSWKLLKAYGHRDLKNSMQISVDEFSDFLLDSKPLLEELKLWSPYFKTFSRNAVLLADLFQEQSDGDLNINLNEATEYIGMLLTAIDLSGSLTKTLLEVCDPGINSSDPVFEIHCFNKNFYDTLLNKLHYVDSLPRLFQYISSTDTEESLKYLTSIEGFARDSNEPGVPINRRDSTLITGAMLNIESTFIRFDKNADNIIDYDELSEAFFTYRSSIISLAGLKPDQEKYAKGVFLYMASKMEVPKTGTWTTDLSFATFNTCVQSQWCRDTFLGPIEAKRINIGKLLYFMVTQASLAPKNK